MSDDETTSDAFGDAWEYLEEHSDEIPPCDYGAGILRDDDAGPCDRERASWTATSSPCGCVSFLCVAHAAYWTRLGEPLPPTLWDRLRRRTKKRWAALECATCGGRTISPTFRLIA
ncbi:hypothetical protein FVP74_09365 [Microbacterium saccharophilum]|uniref:Uncharacterized protein n=1 Tax=Microbacterium saccharophilum TaxID=1213358 RepID=A0A5C8HYD9_9MICO|nr:hypothetical protein [Microbacterium saccharophilum]TXK11527.1 hypothetical protein FVP74_09365 [Microbacterium saccharophilum]GEP49081.1 hypothetical protein MSA03_25890 [Microbacterium saccharophilum]